MAKGNLFLGQARGSIGDVVFYRTIGSSQQISRSRNRKPVNPQTAKQIYQRAIISTVSKAYSAGKAIFDHAFEGYSVPSGAHRRFMKRNLSALRDRVAADADANLAATYSNPLCGPSATVPVPGKFVVSEGSLVRDFFRLEEATSERTGQLSIPSFDETDTVGEYYERKLNEGDIYTFVYYSCNSSAALEGFNKPCRFDFQRLKVRPASEIDSTALLNSSTLGDVFDFETSNGDTYLATTRFSTFSLGSLHIPELMLFDGYSPVSIACIKSREDSGLRSTEQMIWAQADDLGDLAWSDLVAAWTGGVVLGASDLILDGGDI